MGEAMLKSAPQLHCTAALRVRYVFYMRVPILSRMVGIYHFVEVGLSSHCYFTRVNLKKWSHSNFAFQSFYGFIGTQSNWKKVDE